MLLQLNRQSTPRPMTITGTGLPVNSSALPTTRGPDPVVAVIGHPGKVTALPAHLPAGWTMRPAADVDDVLPGEIVLFAGATVGQVANARRILPSRTRIVALVDDLAPAESVAGVLTAGADVCVRGGQPAILASHLVACRRRQLAERWNRLDATQPRL